MADVKWNEEAQRIHPAQDFFREKDGKLVAVTSQTLTYTKTVEKREGKEATKQTVEAREPFIITSKRQAIPCSQAAQAGYFLSSTPTGFGGDRWNRDRLRKFLDFEQVRPHLLEGDTDQSSLHPATPTFLNVFMKIRGQLKHYFELAEEEYAVDALFVMHTYFVMLLETSPILFLNAIKRSGKTKLQRFLSHLCFNGYHCVEPSDASIFRIAHHDKATIFLDELERIHEQTKGGLRILLNARYQKGITVPRVEQEGREKRRIIVNYDLFGPTGLANISGLDDVLEDRCITQILQRTTDNAVANRDVKPLDPLLAEVRADLYELMLTPSYVTGYLRVDLYHSFLEGKLDPETIRELDKEGVEVLELLNHFRQAQTRINAQKFKTLTSSTSSTSSTAEAKLGAETGRGSSGSSGSRSEINTPPPSLSIQKSNATLMGSGGSGGRGSEGLDDTPKDVILEGGGVSTFASTTAPSPTSSTTGFINSGGETATGGSGGSGGRGSEGLDDTYSGVSTSVVGRAYDLWRPLIVMAACTSKEALLIVLAAAEKHTQQRRVDEATENQDTIIIEELIKRVMEDGYLKGQTFLEHLGKNTEVSWLRPEGLGRIMKRLGFSDKRLIHGKVEYLVTKGQLKILAVKLRLDYEGLRREGEEEREELKLLLEDKHLDGMKGWKSAAYPPKLEEEGI